MILDLRVADKAAEGSHVSEADAGFEDIHNSEWHVSVEIIYPNMSTLPAELIM